MPGLLEIAIVVVVLLIFFGYKKLPALGRSAGEGVKQVKSSAQEIVGDRVDPATLGKSAGKGVRELREFKDAVTGSGAGNEPRPPAQPTEREPDPNSSPGAPGASGPPGAS
jgi:TatA/E family protein of Tat protein translocase